MADKIDNREEKLRWLRAEIEKGLDDLRHGRYEDGPTVMAEFRKKLLNLKARKEAENEPRQRST